MILQSDLAAVVSARDRAAKQLRKADARTYIEERGRLLREKDAYDAAYRQSAAYLAYTAGLIALQVRLDELPKPAPVLAAEAAEKEARDLLEGLKKRYREDKAVEPGPLRLVVTATPAVSWEGVLTRLREVPVVAKALLATAAAAVLKQAHAKDPSAPFVTERISRVDVVMAE